MAAINSSYAVAAFGQFFNLNQSQRLNTVQVSTKKGKFKHSGYSRDCVSVSKFKRNLDTEAQFNLQCLLLAKIIIIKSTMQGCQIGLFWVQIQDFLDFSVLLRRIQVVWRCCFKITSQTNVFFVICIFHSYSPCPFPSWLVSRIQGCCKTNDPKISTLVLNQTLKKTIKPTLTFPLKYLLKSKK